MKIWKTAFLAAALAMGAAALPQYASAQSVTISNDDATVLRILQQNGFRQGRVVTRGFTSIRTHACRGNEKFLVKISILGRITDTRSLGECDLDPQPVAGPEPEQNIIVRVRRQLQQQGYRRIVITDDRLPRIVAEACKGNDRVRLALNRRAEVRSERRIGPCEQQFDPNRIVQLLERNGYDRIEVTQTRRPPYTALACRGNDRMEVNIGRFGRLRGQQRVGTCRAAIDPQQIPDILADAGFDRIRVLQRRRTPYLAEACLGERLVEVSIDQYGEIRNRQRVGRCASAVSREDVIAQLQEAGYSNLDLKQSRDGWRVNACRGVRRVTVRVDSYGDILSERNSGECQSQTVLDVLKTLESRGAEKLEAQVEGCFRGNRYRWVFDRLGNRTGRERIGRC